MTTKTRQISVPVSAPASISLPRAANPAPRKRKRNASRKPNASIARRDDSFIVEHPEASGAMAVGLTAGAITGLATKSWTKFAIGTSIGMVAGAAAGHHMRKQEERRTRRQNPGAGTTLGLLAVIGVGSYATWRLIHEGNKLDNSKLPTDPKGPLPPVEPDPFEPVDPSLSDNPMGSVMVRRVAGLPYAELEIVEGGIGNGVTFKKVDEDTIQLAPTSYPFDVVISAANAVDPFTDFMTDSGAEIIDGEPGVTRDVMVRFYAPGSLDFRAGMNLTLGPGQFNGTNEPMTIVAV